MNYLWTKTFIKIVLKMIVTRVDETLMTDENEVFLIQNLNQIAGSKQK